MDPVLLARIQFALTVGFHFLFPPISIGLAWLVVILEYLGWRRNDETYVAAGRFFGKILALTFAIGVASGIVMEFQFGTNWAAYSRFVGDIFGAPLAAEGVFAFFLESGFLGLYLFGRGRVSPRSHWLSILMVAVGATISAFWILVANSWQQTPAGYVLRHGRAELVDFFDAIFNPSTLIRFLHTIDAAMITGTLFATGICAWLLLKGRGVEVARRTLKIAIGMAFVASVLELMPFGDMHARQVANTQPEKLAAMEGLYETRDGAPMVLFGIPGESGLSATVEIPNLLSLMTHWDPNARILGLDAFPESERPPVALPFVSFHLMVMLGLLFIAVTGTGVLLLWRKKLFETRWFLVTLVACAPLPLVANEAGWIAAEVGRQPWIVYRLLRTADGVSVTVPAEHILLSIVMFSVIAVALSALYLFLLAREVAHGPQGGA